MAFGRWATKELSVRLTRGDRPRLWMDWLTSHRHPERTGRGEPVTSSLCWGYTHGAAAIPRPRLPAGPSRHPNFIMSVPRFHHVCPFASATGKPCVHPPFSLAWGLVTSP